MELLRKVDEKLPLKKIFEDLPFDHVFTIFELDLQL